MKKFLFAGFWLLVAVGALAQTKPAGPLKLVNSTLTDSLIRAYVIYEGTGSAVDDVSLYNANGTITNASWSSDAEGNLLQFSPIDGPDYVKDASTSGLTKIGNELTMIVKFKYNSILQGRIIAGRTVTTGTTLTYDWIFYLQGSINRCDLCFDTDLIAPTCFGNTATIVLVPGNWYVFAATYSNADDSVKLYINGVRKHSAKAASGGGVIISTAGREFNLARFGAAKTADVDMHYAYVWNRRLSDAEIVTMYNSPYGIVATESNGYYRRKLW